MATRPRLLQRATRHAQYQVGESMDVWIEILVCFHLFVERFSKSFGAILQNRPTKFDALRAEMLGVPRAMPYIANPVREQKTSRSFSWDGGASESNNVTSVQWVIGEVPVGNADSIPTEGPTAASQHLVCAAGWAEWVAVG